MPIEVLMPALSPTMTEGNLAKWLKKEGDDIIAGDVIAEIETDKATMEVEAVDEGILGRIIIEEGSQSVAVNSLIALILEEGEDKKSLESYQIPSNDNKQKTKDNEVDNDSSAVQSNPAAEKQNVAQGQNRTKMIQPIKLDVSKTNNTVSKSDILISPIAKRIAQEQNIDLNSVVGTGPKGRIVKDDILNFAKSGSAGMVTRNPVEYELSANSNVRKVIAERLLASKQHVPHFYLNSEIRMDKLMEFREELNQNANIVEDKPIYKVSVNDLMIKAIALALKKVPAANSSWDDEAIILYNNIDISVAVAVEDGLITPIIRNADQKSVIDISSEMKSLIKKARDGKLQPEEFQGGGFTISNLGMYGIDSFSAIVNPPQSCILSVGAAAKKAVVNKDNQIEIGHIMNAGLSSDHRSVDGSVGAQFLNALKNIIESPITLLL